MKIKRSTPKEEIIKISKVDCKDCTHCCDYGSGVVLKDEVDVLAKKLKLKPQEFVGKYLDEFTNFNTTHYKFKTIKGDKPYGYCVFKTKNGNGCSIHQIKPLHCRVGTCNEHGEEINIWFTVNHFVNKYDPESVRSWNSHILQGNKIILESKIEEIVPDEKKLKEMLSYKILR